jgi:hypothetical protein
LLSLVFEMLRLPAVLPATIAIVTKGRAKKFKVTPKGQSLGRGRVQPPFLLTFLAFLCFAALVWFAATVAGLTFARYHELPAVIGSVIFAAGNLMLLSMAVQRVHSFEFAGERRKSVRFDVFLRGDVAGSTCVVRDLSLTGALIHQASFQQTAGKRVRFGVHIGGKRVGLNAEIVRLRPSGEMALRFTPGQRRIVGKMILMLLNSPAAYGEEPANPRPPTLPAEARVA